MHRKVSWEYTFRSNINFPFTLIHNWRNFDTLKVENENGNSPSWDLAPLNLDIWEVIPFGKIAATANSHFRTKIRGIEEVTSGRIDAWQSSLARALASASVSARYTWVGELWSASGFDWKRSSSHRNEDPRLIILGFSRLTVFGVSVHLWDSHFTFIFHFSVQNLIFQRHVTTFQICQDQIFSSVMYSDFQQSKSFRAEETFQNKPPAIFGKSLSYSKMNTVEQK